MKGMIVQIENPRKSTDRIPESGRVQQDCYYIMLIYKTQNVKEQQSIRKFTFTNIKFIEGYLASY